jgi:intracellular septation protein
LSATEKPDKPKLNPWVKIALDLGPLVLFIAANTRLGIFGATAVFMVATVVALFVAYALTRHLPVMPLVSAAVVLVFGSLTLILHDEEFIKMKPTIIYALFGAALLGGHLMNRPLLATVLDAAFHLTDDGWRKLTLRWIVFFFALAVANELVWRTQSTNFWFGFKGACAAITFVFAMLQYPLLMKYAAPAEGEAAE